MLLYIYDIMPFRKINVVILFPSILTKVSEVITLRYANSVKL